MKPSCAALLTILFASSVIFGDEKPNQISIATWNVEWFFDSYTGDNSSDLAKEQSAPSRGEWDWKLEQVARVVAEMKPTILALQEIENREVVRRLTKKLSDKYKLKYRIAFIQGWDSFTEQDVAVIYQSGLVQYSCREQTSEMFSSREYYNLNKHLFAEFEWGDGKEKESLTLLTVHLRATAEKHDLRQKQCKLMKRWIEEKISNGGNVIVLGDLNTEQLADSINRKSELAILCGWETATKSDDLYDLHHFLPPQYRSTHLANRQFDRILVSQSMLEDRKNVKDLKFSQIANFRNLVIVGETDKEHFNKYYKIPRDQRDVSDHYPVMAQFLFQ